MEITGASGLWSFVYSITFQIKETTATDIFPGNKNPFSIKPTVWCVKIAEKKNPSIFLVRDLVTLG